MTFVEYSSICNSALTSTCLYSLKSCAGRAWTKWSWGKICVSKKVALRNPTFEVCMEETELGKEMGKSQKEMENQETVILMTSVLRRKVRSIWLNVA